MHQRTYTYVLAPRWDFRPDGPIALGNIIVDPFRPHRVLTRPDPDIPTAPIETVVETDWSLHHQRENGVKSSVWAHFLNAMGVDVGFEGSRSLDADYTVDSLTTSYFRDEPSHEEIIRRTQDGKIRDLMRLDSVFSKPVYMITGVKIAKGFRVSESRSSSKEANAGAKAGTSGTVIGDVTVGTDNKVYSKESDKHQGKTENDVVFAFQLMKIVPKGWKHKSFDVQDFYPKAALLLGDEEEEIENELDVSYATAADFADSDLDIQFNMTELNDSQGAFKCVSAVA
ncbi:hypothetical protein BO83DRAFT_382946 [Aspergillus eucalypticola CBS 122712]|uniref:Uncharacterized protein n=1 Tax=Aspergillus eucalypticola (strain CBS 122712 / IBT 29274) TaxID=1448314 RepID=A0A317URQ8_ASPEC|nr:uncharacterized protein BO83DRAFT_382946 [Aspergillus eucalypticola CBS 122712]PWY63132.1 hypothetical protein BO83DRAFT_382946 [Aspergillus eucalypticola CBS 122712]